jgi:hypothetical protein
MRFTLFVFSAIFFVGYSTSSAKSTWIRVTGIDENDTSQNYGSFYKEARDFEKVCAFSPTRKCVNFINPNFNLMRAADLYTNRFASKVVGIKMRLIAYFWGRKVDIFRQKYLNFRKHTG